jgi:hypothetical protein
LKQASERSSRGDLTAALFTDERGKVSSYIDVPFLHTHDTIATTPTFAYGRLCVLQVPF